MRGARAMEVPESGTRNLPYSPAQHEGSRVHKGVWGQDPASDETLLCLDSPPCTNLLQWPSSGLAMAAQGSGCQTPFFPTLRKVKWVHAQLRLESKVPPGKGRAHTSWSPPLRSGNLALVFISSTRQSPFTNRQSSSELPEGAGIDGWLAPRSLPSSSLFFILSHPELSDQHVTKP